MSTSFSNSLLSHVIANLLKNAVLVPKPTLDMLNWINKSCSKLTVNSLLSELSKYFLFPLLYNLKF